jgi:predicted RNA binding protein YcfA (HicA-like mRNA interferase family)
MRSGHVLFDDFVQRGSDLAGAGWTPQPIPGSHHIDSKAGERVVRSVPVHCNRTLKAGLASPPARDAGPLWSRAAQNLRARVTILGQ